MLTMPRVDGRSGAFAEPARKARKSCNDEEAWWGSVRDMWALRCELSRSHELSHTLQCASVPKRRCFLSAKCPQTRIRDVFGSLPHPIQ